MTSIDSTIPDGFGESEKPIKTYPDDFMTSKTPTPHVRGEIPGAFNAIDIDRFYDEPSDYDAPHVSGKVTGAFNAVDIDRFYAEPSDYRTCVDLSVAGHIGDRDVRYFLGRFRKGDIEKLQKALSEIDS